MKPRARRWLLHRRKPEYLYQRVSWYDFAGQMRRLIGLDIAANPAMCAPDVKTRLTAHITRIIAQPTRPMPSFDAAFYQDETARVDTGADPNATELVEAR